MRRLTAVLLLLGCSSIAHANASVILVVSSASSSANGMTTSAQNASGGSLNVVSVEDYTGGGSGIGTVTDSNSNIYTATTSVNAANHRTTMFYSNNATDTNGMTFTFTCQGGGCFPVMQVFVATNTATSNVVYTSTGNTVSPSDLAILPGSVTPGSNGSLIITGLSLTTDVVGVAIDSSFNATLTTGVGGASFPGAGAYFVQSTAGVLNPNWSWSNTQVPTSVIIVFNPGSGGGGGGTPLVSHFSVVGGVETLK